MKFVFGRLKCSTLAVCLLLGVCASPAFAEDLDFSLSALGACAKQYKTKSYYLTQKRYSSKSMNCRFKVSARKADGSPVAAAHFALQQRFVLSSKRRGVSADDWMPVVEGETGVNGSAVVKLRVPASGFGAGRSKSRLLHQVFATDGGAGDFEPLEKPILFNDPIEQPVTTPIEQPLATGDSCETLVTNLTTELGSIQACSADYECGQQLVFGCGGSSNLIARADADVTHYNAIMEQLLQKQCSNFPLVTTCGFRPTSGYRCNQGMCDWNYDDDVSIY